MTEDTPDVSGGRKFRVLKLRLKGINPFRQIPDRANERDAERCFGSQRIALELAQIAFENQREIFVGHGCFPVRLRLPIPSAHFLAAVDVLN
jgi:hypothetical protein